MFLSVPGGFKALNVTVLSSTSVHVSWAVPVLPNGDLLGYQLHQREAKLGSVESVIYRGSGLSTRVVGLSPYTTYEFRVSANTSVGPGYGPYFRVTTMEDGEYRCVRYSHFYSVVRVACQQYVVIRRFNTLLAEGNVKPIRKLF